MEIWIAIITVLGGVLVSFITSFFNSKKILSDSIAENSRRIAELAIKVDLLWDVNVKEALRDARKVNYLEEKSPLSTTGKWLQVITPPILEKIQITINECVEDSQSFLEIEGCVMVGISKDFYLISIEKDVSVHSLWGGLKVYLQEYIEETYGDNPTLR
jgi:uncharacterized protein YneF (UPF0154 family)